MKEASEPRNRTRRAALRFVSAVAVAWMLAACPQPFVVVLSVAHAQNVPGKPIIVTIPPDKPKSELSGLADVLLGSLGLTGVIVIAAVLLGAVMAGVMFWVRSRQE
jgi:ABC-type phosphate transport system permease subunit